MRFADHPSHFPEGSIVDGGALFKPHQDSADYVIIGSGAAGGTAAQMLSSAGFSVIILEEGRWVQTKDFGVDVFPAMKTLFRDTGGQVANGRAVFPVIQGRCVGGSTTVNSAIAWRAPEAVFDEWERDFGLKGILSSKQLEPHFDALDKALTVTPVGENLGKHNSLFGLAADKLDFGAQRIRRYDSGCDATASCLTGCRSGKKMTMNITFIPESLKNGARIYTSTKALRITKDRVVEATNLRVHAKRGVIVAASAIQTPGILRRSGVKLAALGNHFQVHPGSSIIGRFDHDISMQTGATQGYNSTHFVQSHGFKLEALSLPPELLAARLPYVGQRLVDALMDYKKILNWAVIVKAKAKGSVKSVFGKDFIRYTPALEDMRAMRDGYKKLSEMMFAVGAKEVWPCVHGMPPLKSSDDLRHWDTASLDPRHYSMMASHLFGTARMGPNPTTSVVNTNFEVHGCPGVYVLDSSIFPTNLGVNPQHTIMAVARLGATHLLSSRT
ncbi:MAG: GMC family oxidoreductase [Myxococcota bacterium]